MDGDVLFLVIRNRHLIVICLTPKVFPYVALPTFLLVEPLQHKLLVQCCQFNNIVTRFSVFLPSLVKKNPESSDKSVDFKQLFREPLVTSGERLCLSASYLALHSTITYEL